MVILNGVFKILATSPGRDVLRVLMEAQFRGRCYYYCCYCCYCRYCHCRYYSRYCYYDYPLLLLPLVLCFYCFHYYSLQSTTTRKTKGISAEAVFATAAGKWLFDSNLRFMIPRNNRLEHGLQRHQYLQQAKCVMTRPDLPTQKRRQRSRTIALLS